MHSKRVILTFLTVSAAVVLAAVYYFFDPVKAVWMPRCLWKVSTGTDCPGCGSQRMIHAIMHGDLSGAWHANAYALCMLPVMIFLIWLELARGAYPGLYARVHHPAVIIVLAVSVIIWWICRNIL